MKGNNTHAHNDITGDKRWDEPSCSQKQQDSPCFFVRNSVPNNKGFYAHLHVSIDLEHYFPGIFRIETTSRYFAIFFSQQTRNNKKKTWSKNHPTFCFPKRTVPLKQIRWWCQIFFMFTLLYLGNWSNLTNIFQIGWKPPPRKTPLFAS